MSLNRIRKEDIADVDIVDANELRSDGYGLNSIYGFTSCTSTTASTQTVIVGLAADGNGILYTFDHPVENGDIVWISGTSGGSADGYFTVNSIVDDTTFTINESFSDSTGGIVQFRHASGSSKVGFNPTGLNTISSNNVQDAIKEAVQNSLTTFQHQTLRQLIHFIDEGPADGFASGAYKEVNPPGVILPTSIIWYEDNTLSKKIVEQSIVWSGIVPSTITWMVYNIDGVTVAHTVSDSITYMNNIFEVTRTRTIT